MAGNAEDEPVEITFFHGVSGWFQSGVYFYFEPWSRSRCEFVCGMAIKKFASEIIYWIISKKEASNFLVLPV